jgi:hypothetical protein
MKMAFPWAPLGAWAAFVCVSLVQPSSANDDVLIANPMQKVIELLAVLSKGIEKEGKEDAGSYREYTAFYQKQSSTSKKIIKDTKNKIEQLQSDLEEAKALREAKNKDLVDLANKIAKGEAELSGGRATRKKERALFEKNEATFIESIEQLDNALTVLKKKMPAKPIAASASLLTVAQKLKSTLIADGSDFSLSSAQRETLDGFMRAAQATATRESETGSGENFVEPSFLQVDSNLRGPYGEYKAQSGGLISTLLDLSKKVKTERDAGLKAEEKGKKDFSDWEKGLTDMLENGKKSLADIKNTIAQSQEQSSKKEASLMEAKDIFKAETAHLAQVEAEYRGKTQAYKIRLAKRSDEAVAVHEAQRIMSSEVAKSYIKEQSLGGPPSFVQVSQRLKRSHHRGSARADPFKKVKSMIRGMLEKLTAKQAQEAKHAAWCDREMGRTAKDKKRKEDDVQKMTDRLDALGADLTQLKADIETSTGDLKKITESHAAAKVIRDKEKVQAVKSIKQYKDAAKLLTRAVNVLKSYYKNKDGGGSEVNKKEFKQRHGMGTGIIGILEIAIDDFEKLHDETKEAEEAAAKDFKDMSDEGAVRKAVFNKDLEWKGRSKVKMEFDQSTMKNDLKSYKKELLAINNYMDKLKASCIVKGPTYAEKKAKREETLKSLREALTYLTGS